jgi:hypothetical protein
MFIGDLLFVISVLNSGRISTTWAPLHASDGDSSGRKSGRINYFQKPSRAPSGSGRARIAAHTNHSIRPSAGAEHR